MFGCSAMIVAVPNSFRAVAQQEVGNIQAGCENRFIAIVHAGIIGWISDVQGRPAHSRANANLLGRWGLWDCGRCIDRFQ